MRHVVVDGAVVADGEARLPGRGAYTCETPACFERARARGAFNRAFRRHVMTAAPAPRADGG